MADDSEISREDKRNAILTYREVNSIFQTLTRLETKMEGVAEELATANNKHDDHEIRIRALELGFARAGGGTSTAGWLWQAVWPVAAVAISLLAYLK